MAEKRYDLDFSPDSARYAQTLSEFVKCKTISEESIRDEREFEKFRAYTLSRFPKIFAAVEEHTLFQGGIFIKLSGKKSDAPLVLMSHYDVVPENGEWSKDAFSGEITAESVWGRGTVDTKGSLAAIFEAVEGLLSDGYQLENDLYIISSSREEIAGNDVPDMVKYLKEKGAKPALVIDEGGGIIDAPIPGVSGKYAMIGMVERSSARLLIEARKGKQGTAAEIMSRFILEAGKKVFGKRDFGPINTAMFMAMRPNMAAPLKLIFSNLSLFKRPLIKVLPKVNPAAAQLLGASVAFSTPTDKENSGLATGAVRMVAKVSGNYYNKIDDLVDEFTQFTKEWGLTVKILSLRDTPAPQPVDGQGFKFTAQTVTSIFPDVIPSPYCILGGTDARHFVGYADYVIRFAPIYMNKQQFGSFHNTDENLNISSLDGAVEFYREAIKKYDFEGLKV